MIFIDTHCHLYAEEFKADINQAIERAGANGVKKMYFPAIDSHTHNEMIALEEKMPHIFSSMMGLHPCSVKENYKDELRITEEWLSKRNFAAIGEIGLDFYWDTTFTTQQYDAFEIQMHQALANHLPIVIHTRNAMKQTIECVKPFAAKGLKGIFHCFGDSYETAVEIINMGFYLGIGGVLTYKKSGLDDVLKKIDLQYIVLETDAPYLTPVPFRGKRNETAYIKYIAEHLAKIKNMDVQEIAAITTANAEKIFAN